MNAVDTNVLIYSLDNREPIKQAKARQLLRRLRSQQPGAVVPWQVIGEYMRQLRAWQDQGKMSAPQVHRCVNLVRRSFPIVLPSLPIIDFALDLVARYSLSHWDSMLIGACVEAHIATLYTEDMGSPTTIDSVRLVNPFI
jgi:predicted nucleic acid-binding protein